MAKPWQYFCILCDRPAPHICSRCKIEAYCSRECQHRHWPAHRKVCVRPVTHEQTVIADNTRRFRTALSVYADLAHSVFTLAVLCADHNTVLTLHRLERTRETLTLHLVPLITATEWHTTAIRSLLGKLQYFPFYVAADLRAGERSALSPLKICTTKGLDNDRRATVPTHDRAHYDAFAQHMRHVVTCERHRETALICPCHPITLTVLRDTGRVMISCDFDERHCDGGRLVAQVASDHKKTDATSARVADQQQ